MALKGIKVVEMAGLAPVPFCGMILSDFGASVVRVDKVGPAVVSDHLSSGKRSISVDLKKQDGVSIVRKLCQQADVLIEPFRAGVMEKLGLGPSVLLEENPRLVYARLTGFGQAGPLAHRAGHDINYLAISGVLSRLQRVDGKPQFPVNLLADFAGGGLTCALGIVMALLERTTSGKGQVIDSNMVEGAAYVSSFLFNSRELPIWGEKAGTGVIDGGYHFYDTYQTKDGGYMAVGAIEPQFYFQLIKGLGLEMDEAPQFTDVEAMKKTFHKVFLSKTRSEWTAIFADTDACVTPVLSLDEAAMHPHNKEREAFFTQGKYPSPKPAPSLSRTPARADRKAQPVVGQHTKQILYEMGYTTADIQRFHSQGTVTQASESKL